jgi:hypothetical protein
MFRPLPGAGFLAACSMALASAAGAAEEPRKFYVEDIKGAMQQHIASRVNDDDVFRLRDRVTGEMLALRFVKIHDPVRVIDRRTYFACTDFHVVGEPEKVYDLDFWLRPDGDVLEVYEERVHKEPRRSLLWGWYKHPRYTFVDDEVVPLY